MISEGCYVDGECEFSVLFTDVTVEEGAVVKSSIIMPGSVIRKGAVVEFAIIAENVEIGAGAHVGCSPENMDDVSNWGVAVVGSDVVINEGEVVPPKAMIEKEQRGE